MEILYLLIPISIMLVTLGVLIFRWAVRSGQYDDLNTQGHSILFDEDLPKRPESTTNPHTTPEDHD